MHPLCSPNQRSSSSSSSSFPSSPSKIFFSKRDSSDSRKDGNNKGDKFSTDWDKAWSNFKKQGKKTLFSQFSPDKYVSWNPRRSKFPLSEEVDPIKRTERSNLKLWTSPRFTLVVAILIVSFLSSFKPHVFSSSESMSIVLQRNSGVTIGESNVDHGMPCFSICDRSVPPEREADSDSSNSSSIGTNSDSSEESSDWEDSGENEVQSSFKGPLDSINDLEEVLPTKRGISKFYSGKSKSFTSLSDAGDSAALLSGALNVPMLFTGHSLGRDKLEQLLKQDRLSRDKINTTYKIMHRIEAEELALDASEIVITSTRQEIEKQWCLYDGFDPVLERKLRARIRRNVSCYGRFMALIRRSKDACL